MALCLGIIIFKPSDRYKSNLFGLDKAQFRHTPFESETIFKDISMCDANVKMPYSKLTKDEYVSEILLEKARIQALQSQINPHFLYNTLDTIRSYAISHGEKEINEMTEALAKIFRYSISKRSYTVTFSEELYNIDRYLLIQKYRFQNRFEIIKRFDSDDEQAILNMHMPILTVQPIIENAIYHGLEPKSGKGFIILSAYITKKQFIISVYDNGVGIDESLLGNIQACLDEGKLYTNISGGSSSHSGIAITNVNARIRHYFGNEYGINIVSTKGIGTCVEIVLPQIQSEAKSRYWGTSRNES